MPPVLATTLLKVTHPESRGFPRLLQHLGPVLSILGIRKHHLLHDQHGAVRHLRHLALQELLRKKKNAEKRGKFGRVDGHRWPVWLSIYIYNLRYMKQMYMRINLYYKHMHVYTYVYVYIYMCVCV